MTAVSREQSVATVAQMNAALTGSPFAFQVGGNTTFNAYSYRTAYGLTKYVIVEHGSPAVTGLTRGYVSIWQQ